MIHGAVSQESHSPSRPALPTRYEEEHGEVMIE